MQNFQPAKESIMSPRVGSPAMYRYEDRMLFVVVPLFVLSVIMYFSLSHFHLHPTRIWAVLFAAFMSSPAVALIFSIGRYLSEEKDEFQRSLLVQSILWALGVTICADFFWMVLGTYMQIPRMKDQFLFAMVFIVSFWVNRWRYR
jgi:hypothetical protein